eukprot:CAMPEP_0195082824 /NCGR_PEP_ID=MMETSP0448-20130528/23915_1 /TAXON_ID=66468 /ORGANISM="Heterocapsa triquestra, Strain CCMP 448" /LENGTH=58 /DNA_ID=CAMNT_0040115965 /DNA_START=336 /DNA_END=509 /DNA_ORIENTATION=+
MEVAVDSLGRQHLQVWSPHRSLALAVLLSHVDCEALELPAVLAIRHLPDALGLGPNFE